MLKSRNLKSLFNIWSVSSFIIIMLVLIPNANILLNIFEPVNENWNHIKEYLLQDYIVNSTILVLFTGIFSILIGLIPAWLISQYEFPFRDFFKWALILPLAIPPYIGAYTYNGMLNYTGILQTTLRSMGISVNPAYFDIMNSSGAIFIYTIFLFPYVYIITRSFLSKQSASLVEAARTLGKGPLQIFWHVILPISRGAIVAGVSLVILEVLNDYGVVKYFGIPTFSTAIFKTWFSMGDLNSAVRLSALLMVFVFGVLLIENFSRGGKRYSYSTTKVRPISRIKLSGIKAFLVSALCSSIFAIGFLIPTAQLLHWVWLSYAKVLDIDFLILSFNSIFVALFTSILIVVISIIVANTVRISDNIFSKIYSKIAILGYSIPGAVIAVGVLLFFLGLDNIIYSGNLVLTSTILMLVFAYIIRFLAIGYNSVESGFDKVGKSFFEASRTLGIGITETFFKVDLPMIKPAISSAFLLALIEILKELPLTLILRPFNFDTLATKAFEYASDEMIHEAAISSIIIIFICSLAIYGIHKLSVKRGAKNVN
ncbi:ABC transporter permease [Orenia marismortui]|uniref:ABC transporter permease n=1 Tax=Orenia marismortui TaxID=46469 RepID=UPI00035F6371|nr:iron ABC transporter permease [Orenia marismortui]